MSPKLPKSIKRTEYLLHIKQNHVITICMLNVIVSHYVVFFAHIQGIGKKYLIK